LSSLHAAAFFLSSQFTPYLFLHFFVFRNFGNFNAFSLLSSQPNFLRNKHEARKKAGLESLCEVVCGNFLEMPFPDNSFDDVYSMEETCCTPKLEEVYAEIFKVLKPRSGGGGQGERFG
jgi:ubiquinone/menaquinone biosynthesis C-methylase UbiE